MWVGSSDSRSRPEARATDKRGFFILDKIISRRRIGKYVLIRINGLVKGTMLVAWYACKPLRLYQNVIKQARTRKAEINQFKTVIKIMYEIHCEIKILKIHSRHDCNLLNKQKVVRFKASCSGQGYFETLFTKTLWRCLPSAFFLNSKSFSSWIAWT